MTGARRRVQVVGADRPSSFRRCVIHLIGQATARQIDRGPVRSGGRYFSCDAGHRVGPGDAGEAGLTGTAAHWITEAAEFAQLGGGVLAQLIDVGQFLR